MKATRPPGTESPERRRSHWAPLLIVACFLIALIAILLPRVKPNSTGQSATGNPRRTDPGVGTVSTPNAARLLRRHTASSSTARESAEEIVARKAARFARSRREVVHAMALKHNLTVPDEVERFFDAAEAGDWKQVDALWNAIRARRQTDPHPPEFDQFWTPILATYGALEQVHLWPAQQILDYGSAILDSMRPGMVYVGGTDSGRFIPEMLNETGDGEPRMLITQNGLADANYIEYLKFLYGDRLALPSPDDFQRAYQDYVADYRKRLAHDQQYPDEPKQIRPGERVGSPDDSAGWTVTIRDGDQLVQISGQAGAMAVNELLLQNILRMNPDLSFGLQESYPLKSTYTDAAPLGPIMELRAGDGQNALTAETALQSLGYWQNALPQLLADSETPGSTEYILAYSKLVDAQANLFAARGLIDQAEQAFRLSLQLCPYNEESVQNYTTLLLNQNRTQDALAVAQAALRADPKSQPLQNLVSQLQNPLAQPPGR